MDLCMCLFDAAFYEKEDQTSRAAAAQTPHDDGTMHALFHINHIAREDKRYPPFTSFFTLHFHSHPTFEKRSFNTLHNG